jgi:hypothetical protein
MSFFSTNVIIFLNVLWLVPLILLGTAVATYYLNRAVDPSGR